MGIGDLSLTPAEIVALNTPASAMGEFGLPAEDEERKRLLELAAQQLQETGLSPEELATRIAVQSPTPVVQPTAFGPIVPWQPIARTIPGDPNDPDSSAKQETTYLTDMPWEELTPAQQAWLTAYSEFNDSHVARYGIPIDRPWTNAAQSAKESIDARYKEIAAEYGIPVDESLLGPNAQPNAYYPKPRHHGGIAGNLMRDGQLSLSGGVIDTLFGHYAEKYPLLAPKVSMTQLPVVAASVFLGMFAGPALAGELGAAEAGAAAGGAAGGAAAGTTTAAAQATLYSQMAANAMTGAINGVMAAAANGEDIWEGALRGATAGAAGTAASAGGQALTAEQSAMMQRIVAGAARGAVTAYISDGDMTQGIISGIAGAIGAKAPTPAAQPFTDVSIAPSSEIPGMLPLASPESVGGFLSTLGEAVPGTELPIGGVESDVTQLPTIERAIQTGGLLAPGAVGMFPVAALSTPDTSAEEQAEPSAPVAEEPAPVEAPRPPVDYAKAASDTLKLYQQLTGLMANPPDEFVMPVREEGQTDEEYNVAVGQAAVEYLSLDAEDMAAQGLVPGTQEYLDYILAQADTIIAQVFGADPNLLLAGESVEGMQDALRDLSENEAQQLLQALYVRGALGQFSYQGSATDPFTGITEELGMLPLPAGDATLNPAEAARQRGLARSLQHLAALPGQQGAEYLRGLFGRDVDIFGLQSAYDTRAEAEKRAALEDEDFEYDDEFFGDEDFTVDEYGNIIKRRKRRKQRS